MKLKELAAALCDMPMPVQVRGWTGSGKTTFTKCIVRELASAGVEMIVVYRKRH